MDYDSALNLQADVFKNIFRYQELPQAFASDGEATLPSFVDPTVNVDDYFQPRLAVEMADGKEPIRTKAEHISSFVGEPTEKKVTHEIAVGVGRSSTGEHELVIHYQDRKLKNHSILEAIELEARQECRIRYVGRIKARDSWHRSMHSPLRIGASVAHSKVTAGTLGCFVEDINTGDFGILSNNHVLANVNRGKVNDKIRHPGKSDGGRVQDHIASLRSFVPITLSNGINFVDCAWAALEDENTPVSKSEIHDSIGNLINQIRTPDAELLVPQKQVVKTGRTTGYTNGKVEAINMNNIYVQYARGVYARFDGQIVIHSLSKIPFSGRGDSGSLILTESFEPAALLFAGTSAGGFEGSGETYANPLLSVLQQLNLKVSL